MHATNSPPPTATTCPRSQRAHGMLSLYVWYTFLHAHSASVGVLANATGIHLKILCLSMGMYSNGRLLDRNTLLIGFFSPTAPVPLTPRQADPMVVRIPIPTPRSKRLMCPRNPRSQVPSSLGLRTTASHHLSNLQDRLKVRSPLIARPLRETAVGTMETHSSHSVQRVTMALQHHPLK